MPLKGERGSNNGRRIVGRSDERAEKKEESTAVNATHIRSVAVGVVGDSGWDRVRPDGEGWDGRKRNGRGGSEGGDFDFAEKPVKKMQSCYATSGAARAIAGRRRESNATGSHRVRE